MYKIRILNSEDLKKLLDIKDVITMWRLLMNNIPGARLRSYPP